MLKLSQQGGKLKAMTDIWPIIADFLRTVFPMAATLFGAWVYYKTRQWSELNNRVVENTEKTKELIAVNTQITENIRKDSEYLKKKLLNITAATSFAEGVSQGRQAAIEERAAQDELEAAEAELDGRANASHSSGRLP